MRTAIAKWGNSLALRLPRTMATDVGFYEGARVDVFVEGDRLVVRSARPRYRLAELLARSPRRKQKEVDWGNPQGGEAW